jgi:hypothetical protein
MQAGQHQQRMLDAIVGQDRDWLARLQVHRQKRGRDLPDPGKRFAVAYALPRAACASTFEQEGTLRRQRGPLFKPHANRARMRQQRMAGGQQHAAIVAPQEIHRRRREQTCRIALDVGHEDLLQCGCGLPGLRSAGTGFASSLDKLLRIDQLPVSFFDAHQHPRALVMAVVVGWAHVEDAMRAGSFLLGFDRIAQGLAEFCRARLCLLQC